MPVQLSAPNPSQIFPIPGVNIGIAQAGVKRPGKDDLTIFLLDEGVSIGGVFTKNRFKAAPVQICESILNAVTPCVRALVINTGNANAGTGESGKAHAQMVCKATADLLSLEADQVLPFSTGVIMEPLPFQKIINALPTAIKNATSDAWTKAAYSIMTTDTVAKAFSKKVTLSGEEVTITGIAKGCRDDSSQYGNHAWFFGN